MQRLFYVLFYFFGLPASAFANISVSPFYLHFDSESKIRADKLRFTNNSNRRTTYNIKMINMHQDKDGKYTRIDTPDKCCPFANPFLEWSPHQVTLDPHESQVIRVMRRGMAGVNDGEYVSHLMIQENPPTIPTASKTNADGLIIQLIPVYEITVPIMIDKGKLISKAKITDATLIDSDNSPVVRVHVMREGNKSFYGTLIIKSGREEIGRLDKFRIFTSTPTRTLNVPLNKKIFKDISITLLDENTDEILENRIL